MYKTVGKGDVRFPMDPKIQEEENHLLQTGHSPHSHGALVRGQEIPSSGGLWITAKVEQLKEKC